MQRIRSTGEATRETSFYPALGGLLNAVGSTLAPSVHCVLTPKNRGAGIPDGAIFVRRDAVLKAGNDVLLERAPERGVVEAKGVGQSLDRLAETDQVRRYARRYGQVLVTNYREFLQLQGDESGALTAGERFCIAGSEREFWSLCSGDSSGSDLIELERTFHDFLCRVLLADAPLTSPEDVATFLAAYARIARRRIDAAGDLPALATLRTSMEDALGVHFAADRGREFFHSTLVQTLFYGVFAAWVAWTADPGRRPDRRFSWRTAQWSLNVPMVRVLFEQLTTPRHLPAGLDEILDWTEDVVSRIDGDAFFSRFEKQDAVQYFYEPFLQAYDPELRRQLGVWYTPPEVVRYMVRRVHEALQRDLNIPLGLADERVHVLDPCTGTGSFLVETVRTIAKLLEGERGDSLVSEDVKTAVLGRVHGFELLPAPFVVAHLKMGLLLSELGAPLDADASERPSVYLTNSLTGWTAEGQRLLPFEEFRLEREAAGTVKRAEPILVVIGNPPYNGYSGVVSDDESDLMAPYKQGLGDPPWEITKNKLDDYYIRFFRVAERRIAERTGRGIVCYISNFGWLGDPSTVVMRQRLLGEFDRFYIDNLNGDSRETGKKTPSGKADPSVFSTTLNPSGIQVGTAISLLVRTDSHDGTRADVLYRDFWGRAKRDELTASLELAQSEPPYEVLSPREDNWFRLRRWRPRSGYSAWPRVTDLARSKPDLGLNENRDEALVAIDRNELAERMTHFLDPRLEFADLDGTKIAGLGQPWAGFDGAEVRKQMLRDSPFDESRLVPLQVRPMDVRWGYVDASPRLWNRPRPRFIRAAAIGSDFLLVRRRSPRALDGACFLLSPHLVDQHVLHKDAYGIPLLVPEESTDADLRLFEIDEPSGIEWQPNLSDEALDYLGRIGFDGISRGAARMLWLHALAIGYSPLYLEENADAIRNDWPRIPLPPTRAILEHSAQLGTQVAALLDIYSTLPGLDASPAPRYREIGAISRLDGRNPTAEDLSSTAGWATQQIRTQVSGATSHLVMPGDGSIRQRPRRPAERQHLRPDERAVLGEEVVDIFLNSTCYWSGVPLATWNYKIGGFHVLRKWLSYRDLRVLGRPMTVSEARTFQSMARRITELVTLTPQLDLSYRASVGGIEQDALPLFGDQETAGLT